MSGFQRMIAIPQEEYMAMSSMQNVKEPLAQHFYSLESRYETEEKEKDPYRRLMLQSKTLDQMKQVKEQIRNSLTVATPKPYQSRANALFQFVSSFLRFNDKGEIYSDDGNLIQGSRLEDLIQHAVRDRRRNLIPTGWSDFLITLRDHNVPKSVLNRYTLDELEGEPMPSPTTLPAVKVEATEEQHSPSRQSRTNRRAPPPRKAKPAASAFVKPSVKAKTEKTDIKFLKKY